MAPEAKRFDAFLSHHSADKPVVEALARRLEDEAGLEPFLDKWHLIPGNPWQEELEHALDSSRTCVVFIGLGGIGPWENEEMRSALDERIKHDNFRVVPVLLPDATMPSRGQLPRFLSRLTWVDFRSQEGVNNMDAFHRLVAGIRGVAPGRESNVSPIMPMIECPYRGLEMFDEPHARFFFGREAVTQYLVETLRSTRFLAVIGPSGSGKSSIVRAGLLPRIRRGALPFSDHWRYCIIKPGGHPLEELAVSLADMKQQAHVQSLLKSLEADERELHLEVRLMLRGQPKETRVCLVVDQFEELFTLCENRVERLHFIDTLRYAATVMGGQTVVLCTMRADFMARAAEYPSLAEILSAYQFIISPMDEADLRRVIEEPAQLVGSGFEKGLVDDILQDTGYAPGALPLLEHALLQLWEQRHGDNTMTLQTYREIGGVQGALAKRADDTFATLSFAQQTIARRVLLRLTQLGEGTDDTRRRATLSELQTRPEEKEAVEQVVETLVEARLLVTSKDQQIDVAHEALIRGWPRLRAWVEENRNTLRTHRRIAEAALDWQANREDDSYLYQGTRLAVAEEWTQNHGDLLSILEQRFLDTSITSRDRTLREEEERRERELENAKKAAELDRLRAKDAQKHAEAEAKRAIEAEERAKEEAAHAAAAEKRRELLKRSVQQERVARTPQRYSAFLAGSDAGDGKLSRALQVALHRFAKPWYRLRATRVFHETTSLSASPGLWASIEMALRESAHLILLASPQSADSRWVHREVDYWLQTKSPNTILIVLTKGEIVWDRTIDDFDWERTTALPINLRYVFSDEPLYIDLRWVKEPSSLSLRHPSFRDAVASLAAVLRGIPLDDLYGEDIRQFRRVRRLAWIAILSIVVLTSVAIVSTNYAISHYKAARTVLDNR